MALVKGVPRIDNILFNFVIRKTIAIAVLEIKCVIGVFLSLAQMVCLIVKKQRKNKKENGI